MTASTADDSRTAVLARPVDPAPTSGWIGVTYETLMIVLAVIVVALLTQPDDGWIRAINLAIWAVFVIDYFARLALSGDRRTFVRRHVIDLVAIMPWDFLRAARALRLVRLLRLLRSAAILFRVSATIRGIASTNALGWVLIASTVVVLLGAGTVMIAEPGLDDFGDAVWWAIVTATTVGYGDIAPASLAGRAVAVVLMIVGIGTIGMITGSVATFFLSGRQTRTNPHIDHLRGLLDRWDELTGTEKRTAALILADLANTDDGVVEAPHDQGAPAVPRGGS